VKAQSATEAGGRYMGIKTNHILSIIMQFTLSFLSFTHPSISPSLAHCCDTTRLTTPFLSYAIIIIIGLL